MTDFAAPAKERQTLTVRVPLALRKHGGRKLVVIPRSASASLLPRARVDNAIVKALARAHRWKRMLEGGEFATVEDLAAAEKINSSYLSRVLRLTLLAPDIVEAILDGRQSVSLQLERLCKPFPVEWREQRTEFSL